MFIESKKVFTTNQHSQRLKVSMPRYYSPTVMNHKVKVEPIGKWRSLFYKVGLSLPYFVGDEIKLSISVQDLNPNEEIDDTLTVWVKYPHNADNEEYAERAIPILGETGKAKLVPNIIYQTEYETSTPGSFVISISKTGGEKHYRLVTADIYNDDNFNYFVVAPIGIGIIGLVIGVLVSIVFR